MGGSIGAPTVVFFHGYGADAYDLASLSREVDAPEGTRWVFPQGVLSVPVGPGWMGRAWFQIPQVRLESMMRGIPLDLGDEQSTDVTRKLVAQAKEFIQALGVGDGPLILGGFSQGSVLATELAMVLAEDGKAPQGLVVLSGSPFDVAHMKEKLPLLRGMRFFMSHGNSDQVLPAKGARRLEALFLETGLKGRLLAFEGGHEIPPLVISALSDWFSLS